MVGGIGSQGKKCHTERGVSPEFSCQTPSFRARPRVFVPDPELTCQPEFTCQTPLFNWCARTYGSRPFSSRSLDHRRAAEGQRAWLGTAVRQPEEVAITFRGLAHCRRERGAGHRLFSGKRWHPHRSPLREVAPTSVTVCFQQLNARVSRLLPGRRAGGPAQTSALGIVAQPLRSAKLLRLVVALAQLFDDGHRLFGIDPC